MAKKLIFATGGKGGVGKSMVALSTVDLLTSKGDKVLLIEADDTNSDVAKPYLSGGNENVEVIGMPLEEKQHWMELMNTVHDSTHHVVVNLPARDKMLANVDFLNTAMAALKGKRDMVSLFVINRQRDSLELLNQYMQQVKVGKLVVVRNTYWGKPDQFEFFNTKLKDAIEKNGGLVVDFPDLADRVADNFTTNRMSPAKANDALPFGDKMELQRWRNIAHEVIGVALK